MSTTELYSHHRFDFDSHCDKIVIGEIENIWNNVNNEISRKWVESVAIPVASHVALEKIKRLVAWATLDHDGEIDQETNILEYHESDLEPTVSIIDPWARGAGME